MGQPCIFGPWHRNIARPVLFVACRYCTHRSPQGHPFTITAFIVAEGSPMSIAIYHTGETYLSGLSHASYVFAARIYCEGKIYVITLINPSSSSLCYVYSREGVVSILLAISSNKFSWHLIFVGWNCNPLFVVEFVLEIRCGLALMMRGRHLFLTQILLQIYQHEQTIDESITSWKLILVLVKCSQTPPRFLPAVASQNYRSTCCFRKVWITPICVAI